jgi:hypothetical protein
MNKMTFLINPHTGSIDTAKNWMSELGADFHSAELLEVRADAIDLATLSNRLFTGCFQEAQEGEKYIEEWEENYSAENGQSFTAVYHFVQVKGQETHSDFLPFDHDHIWTIKTRY